MILERNVLLRSQELARRKAVARSLAVLYPVCQSNIERVSDPPVGRLLRGGHLDKPLTVIASYSGIVKMRMPTYDAIPVPKLNYRDCYSKENRMFNTILFSGAAFLGGSVLLFYYTDFFEIDAVLAPKSYRFRKIHRDTTDSKHSSLEALFRKSGETEKIPVRKSLVSGTTPTDQLEGSFEEKGVIGPKPISASLPKYVPYLLIGGGTASAAAAKAIQENDSDARILIVGDDRYYPYSRPPLSKILWWSSDGQMRSQLRFTTPGGKVAAAFHRPEGSYCQLAELEQKPGVAVAFGRRIVGLDLNAHEAVLDDNSRIKYNKCLIATGAKPRVIPQIENLSEDARKYFTVFRDVADFFRLTEVTRRAKCVTVVGGGLLGTELTCALQTQRGGTEMKVVHVYPEAGCLSHLLPSYLSDWSVEHMRKLGVDVRPNTNVVDAKAYSIEEASISRLLLELDSGDKLKTDHVVMAIGVEPNVGLAKESGLELDKNNGGIVCDIELSCAPDVYAAGDCCSYYDFKTGHRRVEHYGHAEKSGALAGKNMTGAGEPYSYLQQFRSALGPSFAFIAVGEVNSELPTVGYFKGFKGGNEGICLPGGSNQLLKPGSPADLSKGVVFYLRDQYIVGVLLWNLPQGVSAARHLLTGERTHGEPSEAVKLFEL